MKRTMKRYLSIVLCLMLVLSLLPVGTMASQTDMEQILTDAYGLQEGEALDYEATLTGVITEIITPYNNYYQNITVEMAVPGYEHMPVRCYRLRGDGAEHLALGDTITVTGILANYYGTVEFQQGCVLETIVCPCPPVPPPEPGDILEAAYALGPGESLPYEAELTGRIVSVDVPYSEMYMNITVTMVVDGRADMPIVCYRMKGYGVELLKVGDTITVVGRITRYVKTDVDTGEVITDQVEFAMPQLVSTGSGETTQLYCKAPQDWELCYVYWWGGSVECPSWPGIAMDIDPAGIWWGSVPTDAEGFVFNNFYDTNTDELHVPTDDRNQYNVEQKLWTAYGEELQENLSPDSLALVGSGLPGIAEWDPADPAGDMTEVSLGIYVKTLELPAACEIEFKIVGNDIWDGLWVFGGGAIQPGEWFKLERGSGAENLHFAVEERCTLSFTIDLNGLRNGDYAYLLVETDTLPVYDRKLTVYAPDTWTNLYAYTWEPEGFGSFPGAALQKSGDAYKTMIPGTLTNLVFSCLLSDGLYYQTPDIHLEPNDYDVIITIDEEGLFTLEYENSPVPTRRLVVFAPDFWSDIRAYTWDPCTFGDWPGRALQEYGDHYEMLIPETLVNLVISGLLADGTRQMLPDIYLECNGQDVYIAIENENSFSVYYSQPPVKNRRLIVYAPDFWSNVYAYTWDPESFGNWPGTSLESHIIYYEMLIPSTLVNLVLSGGMLPDTTIRYQTSDIILTPGTKDVTVIIRDDGSHTLQYGNAFLDHYRVVGNASWMGDWFAASDAGLMEEIGNGVYQKCFENVAPGSYEFKITEDGKWDNAIGDSNGNNFCFDVERPCDVTVTLTIVDGVGTVDVQLTYHAVMGDVTGDGKVNLGDVSQLYAHIRGSKLMSEQALLCADFNEDGKINMGDISNIYAYVRGTDPKSIVDAAYRLEENQELSLDSTLTGTVTEVIVPYNAKYGCVTVKMTVAGREDYPILCSRLMGADTQNVGVGDKIKVTGRLRNFYGTVEFKEGCQLLLWENVPTAEEKMAAIVDEAYALGNNEIMDRPVTLTGKIISVDQAYNGSLPYISVTIEVSGREGMPILCYRMVGEQISKVKKDDTITVTGTLRNFYGNVEFAEGCRLESYVPGNTGTVETDILRIVDLAYALGRDEVMAYDVTLTGKVIDIKEAYHSQYQNISVMLQIAGRETKPILLFRLEGTGIEKIAVNDTVTVTGRLKNYNGTVEMDYGTMINRVSGGGTPAVIPSTPADIMAAAQKLKDNEELPYTVTLTGKVLSIDEAYDSVYQTVTVTILVDGTSQELPVYRLKGVDVEKIAVNDTITVTGKIKRFYGSIELVSGTMTKRVSGGGVPGVQTDYKKIVDEAYALENGASLAYDATLEGRIVELQSPYDAQYKNMTVAIVVTGREDKPIVCYRMKGDNIGNHLCVGDTITVEGKIKNYNGTIEFDAGCRMTNRKAGSTVKPSDPEQIVDAAFRLGENEILPYIATLTGTVKSIDEEYTPQYKNVTVTVTVQGTNCEQDIVCYRLKGDGAENITVGNTITVTGVIERFVRDKDGVREDFVEFDTGCILESLQR